MLPRASQIMIMEIIKALIWPVAVVIVVVLFLLIYKREIANFIKGIRLKKIIIPKKLKLIFSEQYEVIKENKGDKNIFFENLYSKMTGAQLRFLLILRESMKIGGKGMDCRYVSQYFQNIIKSKTDRYDGWITPFITAYLQKNGLVSVADNFFRLNKIGEDFLNYIEDKEYKRSDKEL